MKLYRSIIGALQYVIVIRPEIAYSVNKGCLYMQAPLEFDWKVVKRIPKCLKGTLHHGYIWKGSLFLILWHFMMLLRPLISMTDDHLIIKEVTHYFYIK